MTMTSTHLTAHTTQQRTHEPLSDLHAAYIAKVNGALTCGRDDLAHELGRAYAHDAGLAAGAPQGGRSARKWLRLFDR